LPVCFLGEDEDLRSPIKVGVAKDIGRRKSDLQSGNPLELKLHGWITSADNFEAERDLRRRLASGKLRFGFAVAAPQHVNSLRMATMGRPSLLWATGRLKAPRAHAVDLQHIARSPLHTGDAFTR
jgi:hypothetical protein